MLGIVHKETNGYAVLQMVYTADYSEGVCSRYHESDLHLGLYSS